MTIETLKNKKMMDFYPKAKWAKFLIKTPIIFWRVGLGPITGKIFLLVTTWGRKSGLPRRTMIEYHKINGIKYAPCAFGEKADWYQNLRANPHVTIQSSDGTESAIAYRVINDEELLEVYKLFMRRDPPLTSYYLASLGIEENPKAVLANKEKIVWIGFKPTAEVTPPSQEVDLAWLWPLGLISLLFLWLLNKLNRQ